MASRDTVIAIVGPTASGKTSLAIEIALQVGGEIICADSRTVYRAMDIGTAKPTKHEREMIVHWGLDLVEPGERFTAAQFQKYAQERIVDIQHRGKVPIMVGGTGLYVDGMLFDYQFPSEITPEQRDILGEMTTGELYRYCLSHNIELPINDKNQRHLIRAIAHAGFRDQRNFDVKSNTYVYGIVVDKSTLDQRISERAEGMFRAGIIEEARNLLGASGHRAKALFESVYPRIDEYLRGGTSLDAVREALILRDRQLAKRQMTWFRRNPYIQWGTAHDIEARIKDLFTPE